MNYAIHQDIKSDVFRAPSPVVLLKSIKNKTETDGIRRAMIKDGVALVQFWQWLENALAAGEKLTELCLSEKLRSFRAEQGDFFSESFPSIVGYGSHGAIVHYHATPKRNANILINNILLLDSGAQYLHGTTDITRTFALGTPTVEQKRHYTLVLKGHIALAQAIFPEGTCGYQLDILARQFLWREGLNYGHGTGHGIGYFLCVHEPPQNISPRPNQTPLQAGMAVSNEPGIYFENKYGIRLENLMMVVESEKSGFLSFETLSLFPFDNKLIDFELLTKEELAWLRHYNQRILECLSPYLTEENAIWLQGKCFDD
jgi:Xaa-Pro aminopeptidase